MNSTQGGEEDGFRAQRALDFEVPCDELERSDDRKKGIKEEIGDLRMEELEKKQS